MTLVIADTGPIHYLALIDAIGVLPRLYHRVLIPSAVCDELAHPNSPSAVRKWIATLPEWCEVREAETPEMARSLGVGEAQAIALAEKVKADLILLDDRAARAEALRRGLLVTGTIGVLVDAADHALISLPDALDRLTQTTFYASPELLADVRERYRRRQNPPTTNRE